MADNLTISISADSSKLRADLALAQSKLREFGKEVKKAADEARKTGDTTRLREVSAQYETMAGQVRGVSRALGEHNKTAAVAAREVGGIATAIDNVGLAANRAQIALRALFALQGMRQVANAVDDVYNKINDIQKEALGTGFTPQGVATVKEILGDLGINADTSGQALSKFNEAVIASQEKLGMLKEGANGAAAGVRVLRGDTIATTAGIKVMRGELSNMGDTGEVRVFRGDKKPIEETTTAFGKLSTAMRDIGKTFNERQWQTNEDRIKAVSGALADLTKVQPELAASLGRDIFGRNYAELAAGILKVGEAWNATQADLRKSGRMPTDEDKAALKEYQIAIDAVGDAWEAAKKKGVLSTHETTIAVLNAAGQLIEGAAKINQAFDNFTKDSGVPLGGNLVTNTIREFEGLRVFFAETLPGWASTTFAELKQAFADLGTAFSNAFWLAFNNVMIAGNDLWNWFGEKLAWLGTQVSNAWAAVKQLPGTVAGGDMPPMPAKAAGGMIRGRGTGTSDSILARLSNGEFVMRAAAVRHWGPQLLGAMNALNRPLRGVGDGEGFADGGMVATTSDGVPVHLHLGGSQFQLRGDKAIVESLTREARRAALLGSGRLPGAAFG